MLWVPRGEFREVQTNLQATPSATGPGNTLTTLSATPHTKSSYTDAGNTLISSTNFEVHYVTIMISNTRTSATITDTLVDIGIGGSGSEVTLIPNLMGGWGGGGTIGGRIFSAPLYIPKGTRIAARAQSIVASKASIMVAIFLWGGPSNPFWPVYTGVDAYGINTADSGGQVITPGSTGAESAWVNVGGTTSRPYKGITMMASGNPDVTMNGQGYHLECGYSSTTLGEWYYATDSSEWVFGPFPYDPYRVDLPSGVQLQARGEAASSTVEAFDVALYCLY